MRWAKQVRSHEALAFCGLQFVKPLANSSWLQPVALSMRKCRPQGRFTHLPTALSVTLQGPHTTSPVLLGPCSAFRLAQSCSHGSCPHRGHRCACPRPHPAGTHPTGVLEAVALLPLLHRDDSTVTTRDNWSRFVARAGGTLGERG